MCVCVCGEEAGSTGGVELVLTEWSPWYDESSGRCHERIREEWKETMRGILGLRLAAERVLVSLSQESVVVLRVRGGNFVTSVYSVEDHTLVAETELIPENIDGYPLDYEVEERFNELNDHLGIPGDRPVQIMLERSEVIDQLRQRINEL
uniref:Uncharacterized protein n=1 Tax=Compsopogon caeruleus TaxID=31354 RepID=A0A7S1TIH2_9RHOD